MHQPEVDLQAVLPDGYALQRFDAIDSTNSAAQRWLEAGHAPQALFIAASQTGGRGRRGRIWQSPPGNLYASLLIPAPATPVAAGHYGFVISLAIRDAIADLLLTNDVVLKWPNDVLVADAKVAGVLLELAEGSAGAGLIIGFGVNIVTMPADAPYAVTSLAAQGATIMPPMLATAITKAFWGYADMPLPALLQHWQQHARRAGAVIQVNMPQAQLTGIFMGLAADGALRLQLPDGDERLIHSGEIFFGA